MTRLGTMTNGGPMIPVGIGREWSKCHTGMTMIGMNRHGIES